MPISFCRNKESGAVSPYKREFDMSDTLLVQTSVPDEAAGRRIGRILVEERLAACATLSAESLSFYWWEGKISTETERILFIKTRKDLYENLEARIRDIHPYSLPEIIAFPIEKGLNPYLEWIVKETKILSS